MCDKNNQNCITTVDQSKSICSNFYLLLGHGATKQERIIVPKNFNVITFSIVGDLFNSGLNDLIFLELFSKFKPDDSKTSLHRQLIKLLSSPFLGNHTYLDNLDLKLHPPGCEITNIHINFKGFSSIDPSKQNIRSLMKAGIYKMGSPEINDVYKVGSKKIFYENVEIDERDLLNHIGDILAGTDENFRDRIVGGNALNIINGRITFDLQNIFQIYGEVGGTFFIPICRPCENETSLKFFRQSSAGTDSIFNPKFDIMMSDRDGNNIASKIIQIILLSNFRLILSLIENYDHNNKVKVLINIDRITIYNDKLIEKVKEHKTINPDNSVTNLLNLNKQINNVKHLLSINTDLISFDINKQFIIEKINEIIDSIKVMTLTSKL